MKKVTPAAESTRPSQRIGEFGPNSTDRAAADSGTFESRPFEKVFNRINSELNEVERRAKKSAKSISGESLKLLELQIDVNRITVDTQLAVKAAETVTGSIKQLQQLSNG